ncbi:MAG: HYR domain-containing protein [Acidobacteriia bacterium]|nr:HYR domain-containing protein [Terriglobia bacterium]
MRRVGVCLALALVALCLAAPSVLARDLSFEQRVAAEEAIERVYYSHQIGATKPFEAAVPRAVLEEKVRKYLKQSVALERYWKTPVTAEMLRREMEREARGTRMPERLQELYTALGNDAFLIQECLARPGLVERLTQNFFAFDQGLHAEERNAAEALHAGLVSREIDPALNHPARTVTAFVRGDLPRGDGGGGREGGQSPIPDLSTGSRRRQVPGAELDGLRAQLENAGDRIGPLVEEREGYAIRVLLDETPGELRVANFTVPKKSRDDWWLEVRDHLDEGDVRAVAIGAVLAPEAASSLEIEGGTGSEVSSQLRDAQRRIARVSRIAQCVPEDAWDNGTLDDLPDPREHHTAVWTGSVMVVWGGESSSVPVNSGGRYDPATDTWTLTSTAGAPSARSQHLAVWTGNLMVIWGGYDGDATVDTGGRYDPITDTWTATSIVAAPAPSYGQTAVWTGSVMVVWGGGSDYGPLNTGGRYDPAADIWTATSTVGSPSGRYGHTAIWTGSVMVVWGGQSNSGCLIDGGRYDPTTDTWSATSTAGAPSLVCWGHTAVWTGSVMLVWGSGYNSTPGGRYDPVRDTWTAMSTVGAPAAGRYYHTAVWTGNVMVVWGGYDYSVSLNSGGRYDPVKDTWALTTTAGAPSARWLHTAVWTGRVMVVWGGVDLDNQNGHAHYFNTGARYDPVGNRWTTTSTAGAPSARRDHTAVWTGSVMVAWGGNDGSASLNTGVRYDPAIDTWTTTSTTRAPSSRYGHAAVWTGSEMLVWGGLHLGNSSNYENTGGRYDPTSDAWTPTSPIGAPPGRTDFSAVWAGTSMIVWGGWRGSYLGTGGRYDPATDIWKPTSSLNAPAARAAHTAVWAGHLMLVWGGMSASTAGGRYDPATDTWTAMSIVGAPAVRPYHTAVWTGSSMLIWGGRPGYTDSQGTSTGGRYDPVMDAWTPTSIADAPSERWGHTAVWTGSVMVVWGGQFYSNGSYWVVNTGGRYDPATDTWAATSTAGAASARCAHTAAWTGSAMVVWGGSNGGALGSGGRYLSGGETAPIADAGPDLNLECTDIEQAAVTLDGSGSTDCDSTPGTHDDIASFDWSEGGTPLGSGEILTVPFPLGTHHVTLTATDRTGATGTDDVVITVQDSTPPMITCAAPITIECQANLQSWVIMPLAAAIDVCQPGGLVITNSHTPNGADASATYPLGSTSVTFTATDGSGNSASCVTFVTVVDTTPPLVTVDASPPVLWPPNHKMRTVHDAVTVLDACDPSPRLVLQSIVSSEPDDAPGEGDGSTTDDVQDAAIGTADLDVLLRAERDGSGPGRTYAIEYRAVDASGNVGTGRATVSVPHDQGAASRPVGTEVGKPATTRGR